VCQLNQGQAKQPRFRQTKNEIEAAASTVAAKPAGTSPPSSIDMAESSYDDELQEWAKARKQEFKIPWRQVSLMASLCFGIASFVLPHSVNQDVQWLLYALAAASLFGGVIKRH
jgi:hypothetical protein